MESMGSSTDPREAGAELARAEGLRASLAGALRLPSWFHESLGTATGRLRCGGGRAAAAVPGLNGVTVRGLASRAVLGTSTLSSLVYAGALAASVWAALAGLGLGWLAALAALAGGVGYALSGRHWWATYRRRPEAHAEAESTAYLVAVVLVCLLGLAALLAGRW